MRTYFPMLFSSIVLLFISSLSLFLVRYLNQQWWQNKNIRKAFYVVPLIGLALNALWAMGTAASLSWLTAIGAGGVSIIFIITFSVFLSLPIASVFNLVDRGLDHLRVKSTENQDGFSNSRRQFLRSTAAAFPLLTTSGGLTGLTRAFEEPRTPILPLRFKNLPPGLEGLKILHLSDLHLGYYLGLKELENLLARLEPHRPDLVLVTGDVADKLELLPEVLRMIDALKPPLGTLASLGNHEYFRGIDAVLRHFEAGPSPLLRENGSVVQVDGAKIYVGGADDPRAVIRTQSRSFLTETVDAAFAEAPSDAFKILMSHRPEGFVRASKRGIDLTLAGHTHGMQIGINGRSVFEAWAPEKFLWGHYERGESQLYTSSGVGHWFPFRLGCPPEAPIIVLHKQADDEDKV